MLRRFSVLLCVFCFVACCAGIASAVQYTIVDLGPIPTDTQSFAYGVQRIGGVPTAAGRSNTSGKLVTWAYNGPGSVTATNYLPQLSGIGGTAAAAYYLAPNGDMVGNGTFSGVTKQFYLPSGGTGVLLNSLGGSTSSAAVWGMGGGRFSGYTYDASGIAHAVVWNSSGAVTDLGLNGSTVGTWARQISPDGNKVVGDFDNTPGQDARAAIWTYSGGSWTMSTPIPLATYNQSSFYSINSSGDAVGVLWNYGSAGFPSTTRHALMYKHTGEIVDLGDLGGTSAIGYSINDSGVVVGTDIGTGVFVNYYGAGGANTCRNLFTDTTLHAPDGTWANWTSLSYAFNVDNAGDIVGRGYWAPTGAVHGYMLVPIPEPSTLLLVATGLVSLLAYAWRKRS